MELVGRGVKGARGLGGGRDIHEDYSDTIMYKIIPAK